MSSSTKYHVKASTKDSETLKNALGKDIVSKDEIDKFGIEKWNDGIHIAKKIKAYFRENGIYESYINEDTKIQIKINTDTIDESFSKKELFMKVTKEQKDLKVALALHLPEIIQ